MPLRTGSEMPALTGATEWIGGESPAEPFLGSPTLVQFWALSCYICKDNMPTLQEWKRTYGPLGLKMVAVHMPRQESDMDVEQVRAAVAQFSMDEPCAIDNEHTIGDRFQTAGLWPHYFLFDAEGKLRGRSAGNAGLGIIEGALKRMLEQPAAATAP